MSQNQEKTPGSRIITQDDEEGNLSYEKRQNNNNSQHHQQKEYDFLPQTLTTEQNDEPSIMEEKPKSKPNSKIPQSKPKKRFFSRKALACSIILIAIAAWLIALTIIYVVIKNRDEPSNGIETCSTDSNCSKFPETPFCDPYSKRCSTCTKKSDCDNVEGKKVCDVFGSRKCHQCVKDYDCPSPKVCNSQRTCQTP
jgi:hypothetical protein